LAKVALPTASLRLKSADTTAPTLSHKRQTRVMVTAVDRAIALWAGRPAEGDEAEDAFRTAYADPVIINGVPMSVADLTARARSTYDMLANLSIEVVDRFGVGDRCAVAFRQSGRHVGRAPVPDALEPDGRVVSGVGIDLFTITDDRISHIWVVSEVLGKLVGR